MQYRLVALLLQLPQHPSYLPFADVHFRCRLSARDQPLGGFLQHYQTVSLPLGHSQNSWFFHSPSVTLSSGHFYLVQTGHYHVAATPGADRLKGIRDQAILCVAIGCGLRRSEIAALTVDHLQLREGRRVIVDL